MLNSKNIYKDLIFPQLGMRLKEWETKTPEQQRRIYQHAYYKKHVDKAKEYQRRYNRNHKKKVRTGQGEKKTDQPREVIRKHLNAAELMDQPPEKFEKDVAKIINGEKTMNI